MTLKTIPDGSVTSPLSFSAGAVAAGLKYRPLAVTAKDTLDWWETLPEERKARRRAGLAPEKEEGVLKAWHERE